MMPRLIRFLGRLCLCCTLLLTACPIFAVDFKTLSDHVPAVVSKLQSLGDLPATNELRLAIGLPLRDAAGLDAFLAGVNDPHSPNYRQFLTPEQFAERFAPTTQQYEMVKSFARLYGLKIAGTHANRMVLDVVGNVADVQRALNVRIKRFKHPREGRTFFAPDMNPAVTADLPIVDVVGLDNYQLPKSKLARKKLSLAKSAAKAGTAPDNSGDLFGDDFRKAYVPDTTLTGVGQSVGLVQFDNYYSNDVVTYARLAGGGRTNIVIKTVLIGGYDGTPTSAGNGEVSLDIQMAMAMAPGLSSIVVFTAGPYGFENDVLSSMASSNSIKSLSCSWGWSGGPKTTTDNLCKQLMAQGQTLFNASGDSDAFTIGSSSVNGVDNSSTANVPSSSPYIIQVGGTTLNVNSSQVRTSETVWNWGGGTGSSGGISSYYAIPTWQTNTDMTSNQGSSTKRNIPDVAMAADNIYSYADNGWSGTVGGSSAAAPLWAGLAALANQQAELLGKSPIGFINPAIYAIAAGSNYLQCFHDVTVGDNTWTSSPSQFYAATGYDLCTGLGTPAGQALIDTLVGAADDLAIMPSSDQNAIGPVGGPFYPVTPQIVLTNTGATALNWVLLRPAAATWLNLAVTNGSLPPHGSQAVELGFTAAANSLSIGNYSTSLIFSNLSSSGSHSLQFQLQVQRPLYVTPTNPVVINGPVGGGQFIPGAMEFQIVNLGTTSAVWRVSENASWLAVNAVTGSVAGVSSNGFIVTVTTNANKLKAGTYKATLSVADAKKKIIQKIPFTLRIGQTLANNGGFETGNFSGWNLTADNTQVTSSKTFVHSGSRGAALGQADSMGELTQQFSTSPGQSYQLSLWLKNPQNTYGATPNEIVIEWNGTNLFDWVNMPYTGWTNLQFLVSATDTNSLLRIRFQHNPYFFALDDVSLKLAPTPLVTSSSAVLAVGEANVKRVKLNGHVVPASKTATGLLAGDKRLSLAIGLPLRNKTELQKYLHELYDPSSTNYHRYLSPAEFTAQYGPTEAQYEMVKSFARKNSLSVQGEHPNRLILNVEGSVGDIERALAITLRTYRQANNGRTFFGPEEEPSIPAGLPVADIQGLSDFSRPVPMFKLKPTTPQPRDVRPNYGSGPGGQYRGYDFRAAYVPGTSLTGSNQIVGLVQFDGYYTNDIATYVSQTGLPGVPLQNVLIDSFSGAAGGNNAEVALDIEMVISMAPNLAKLIVYEGNPNNFIPNNTLNRIATDNQAKSISSSWSWTGGPNTTTDNILAQMAAQGQSYFTASGDSDAYTGSNTIDTSSSFTCPITSPYAIAVGGTTLSTTGPGGVWTGETVWNWNNSGVPNVGSGGGISTYYAIPSWQTNATTIGNSRSTTKRNIPDVALTADNIYVVYNNGATGTFGGTSCAAPLWAGFTALMNEQSALAQKSTVGFLNPAIYALAATTNYNVAFRDVTTGNNVGTNTAGLYPAVAGYDLCTGLGTPNGTNLINALVPLVFAATITNVGAVLISESANPTNGAIDPGETVTVNFALKNTGNLATSNLLATLQSSANILFPSGPVAYGVIAPGTTSVQSFTFTAAGICGTNFIATIQLQDGAQSLGSVNVSLSLGKSSSVSQNFDAVTPPALPVNWSGANISGTAAAWVTTSASVDTAPNSAFLANPVNPGQNALVSEPFTISASGSQLTFRHNYALEYVGHTAYDGGLLEIKIGSASFTNITSVGGVFASNGYNGTITSGSDNPLAGRSAWVNTSSGWKTVTVNLPASTVGQIVQFRWNCATDTGNSGGGAVGWYVDSVSVKSAAANCLSVFTDLAVGQALSPDSLQSGQPLNYTLSVTNLGPQMAARVLLTNVIPSNTTFVSAPGGTVLGNSVVFSADWLPVNAVTNFTVSLMPVSGSIFTNTVSVATATPEITLANNSVFLVSTQTAASVVLPTLTATSFAAPPSGFTLQLTGIAGSTYILESSTNLFFGAWLPIETNTADSTGTWQFTDTNATSTPSRFYRLKLVQ